VAERTFARWTGKAAPPLSFSYPPLPAPRKTTIYLVDKPGAAQSTITIGQAGPPRTTPDFFALRVMNSLFGELFQSRLNANLREDKGYSYGVGSEFAYGRGPGPFSAGGDVVTAKSGASLVEMMKEIDGIRGTRPVTDDEMDAAKNALVQSLPTRFSSVRGIGSAIGSLYVQGLPDDYFQQYGRSVYAVTTAEVVKAAREHIDPDHLTIVIVGDRKAIESPLTARKIAPIVHLDVDGNPVARRQARRSARGSAAPSEPRGDSPR
jgi:zinc protease